MTESLKERLRAIVDPANSLRDVVDALRCLRDEDVSQHAVEGVLQEIREETGDEATEDRILEALDFVVGFTSPANRVWE